MTLRAQVKGQGDPDPRLSPVDQKGSEAGAARPMEIKMTPLQRWKAREVHNEEERQSAAAAGRLARQEDLQVRSAAERKKWLEDMRQVELLSYVTAPTLPACGASGASHARSAEKRVSTRRCKVVIGSEIFSKEHQRRAVKQLLQLNAVHDWRSIRERDTELRALASVMRASDPEISAWIHSNLREAQSWWKRGRAERSHQGKREEEKMKARAKLEDLELQLKGQVLELEIKALQVGHAHSRKLQQHTQPHAAGLNRISVCSPILL